MARLSLNARTLTKKRTRELVAEAHGLREDLTDRAAEAGNQALLYELPDGTILWVYGDGEAAPGRGDVYTAECAETLVAAIERTEFLFSAEGDRLRQAAGDQVMAEADQLVADLSRRVGVSLPLEYRSLDVVAEWARQSGLDAVMRDVYPHLFAFVGEIYRARFGGEWVRWGKRGSGYADPYVLGQDGRQLIPDLVVFEASIFVQPYPFPLRRAATKHAQDAGRTGRKPQPDSGKSVARSVPTLFRCLSRSGSAARSPSSRSSRACCSRCACCAAMPPSTR